jgi:hypothetical protein
VTNAPRLSSPRSSPTPTGRRWPTSRRTASPSSCSGGADSDAARAFRLVAETALDQRADLEVVGETAKGKLWRITGTVADRLDAHAGDAWRTALVQAGVVIAALLLALPTRRSLEEARRRPRVVGRSGRTRRSPRPPRQPARRVTDATTATTTDRDDAGRADASESRACGADHRWSSPRRGRRRRRRSRRLRPLPGRTHDPIRVQAQPPQRRPSPCAAALCSPQDAMPRRHRSSAMAPRSRSPSERQPALISRMRSSRPPMSPREQGLRCRRRLHPHHHPTPPTSQSRDQRRSRHPISPDSPPRPARVPRWSRGSWAGRGRRAPATSSCSPIPAMSPPR